MCTLKKELAQEIKDKYKLKNIGKVVGVTNGYLTQILNGKSCSKPTAYCITKYLDKDAEIEDYFIINK